MDNMEGRIPNQEKLPKQALPKRENSPSRMGQHLGAAKDWLRRMYDETDIPIPGTKDRYVNTLGVTGGLVAAAAIGLGVSGELNRVDANEAVNAAYQSAVTRPLPEGATVQNEVTIVPIGEKDASSPKSNIEGQLTSAAEDEADDYAFPDRKITQDDLDKIINFIPENMRPNAEVAIPLMAQALKDEGYDSARVFAYAVATAEHESHLEPKMEDGAEEQAVIHSYEGGVDYAGRGYIQLTGIENYREIGDYLGLDLVNNPELLFNPEIAAKALAAFFKINGIGELAEDGKLLEARKKINPGEFGMEEEHYFRTPYNIRENAKFYLEVLAYYANEPGVSDEVIKEIIEKTDASLRKNQEEKQLPR